MTNPSTGRAGGIDKKRPSVQFAGMDDKKLLDEITTYCGASGMKPSTLGLKALGNSRFVDRLKRRIDKSEEDAATVRAFMRDNPPATRPTTRRRK